MKIKRLKKSQVIAIRERINKFVKEGFSFEEIADIVKLNSRQLVAYHFKKSRKELSNVASPQKIS